MHCIAGQKRLTPCPMHRHNNTGVHHEGNGFNLLFPVQVLKLLYEAQLAPPNRLVSSAQTTCMQSAFA